MVYTEPGIAGSQRSGSLRMDRLHTLSSFLGGNTSFDRSGLFPAALL